MRTSIKKQPVLFTVSTHSGNRVYLSGTFNDWVSDSIEMEDIGNGRFQKSLALPEGKYEYKFVIDDKWTADPQCPHWNTNEHGSLNSVVHVIN